MLLTSACLFQEWEEKASEDKKRFEQEWDEWMKSGGAEAMAAAKKATKAAKRKEKAASKASSSSSPKKSSSTGPIDSKAGSGGNFKSKEFIDESSSGSD